MVYRWFRSFHMGGSGLLRSTPKMIALFITKCCPNLVSSFSETTTSGSFVSTERSGSDGYFIGTDWTFQSASASFVDSDHFKYLVVVDPTNAVNNGIYKIRKVNSSIEIEIDFRCDSSEYPTTASSLDWYLLAYNYDRPPNNTSNYFRIGTTHSTGWSLEISGNASYIQVINIRVAVDGNWSGSKILGTGYVDQEYSSNRHNFFDMVVDDAGEFIAGFNYKFLPSSTTSSFNYFTEATGFMVNKLTAISGSSRPDEDLIVLSCPMELGGNAGQMRDNYIRTISYSKYWNSYTNSVRVCYPSELTCASDDGATYKGLYANSYYAQSIRDDGIEEYDIRGKLINNGNDLFVDTDVYNTSLAFRYVGYSTHYLLTAPLHIRYGGNQVFDYESSHPPLTLSRDSDKDWLAYWFGWCIPWCGLSYVAF